MTTTGVLPFVRSVDFSRNDFSVSFRAEGIWIRFDTILDTSRMNFLKIWL